MSQWMLTHMLHAVVLVFRFDWFFKSRTPPELQRRADTLIRLIEKELEDENVSRSGVLGRRGCASCAPGRWGDGVSTVYLLCGRCWMWQGCSVAGECAQECVHMCVLHVCFMWGMLTDCVCLLCCAVSVYSPRQQLSASVLVGPARRAARPT
jgi:hypothetical protein